MYTYERPPADPILVELREMRHGGLIRHSNAPRPWLNCAVRPLQAASRLETRILGIGRDVDICWMIWNDTGTVYNVGHPTLSFPLNVLYSEICSNTTVILNHLFLSYIRPCLTLVFITSHDATNHLFRRHSGHPRHSHRRSSRARCRRHLHRGRSQGPAFLRCMSNLFQP